MGQGHAWIDGREITHWGGMLPRNLFFYLVDHPLARRDDIFLDFWEKLAFQDATDIFHVTKHKINGRGDLSGALKMYTQALVERPEREDVHRAAISLYLRLGNPEAARRQYRILESDIYQKLAIKPAPESLELLRQMDAAD